MTGGAVPLWRRLPQRGFSNAPFKTEYDVVNVGRLNRFADGAVVTPDELRREGVIKGKGGAGVKVLANGELRKSLTVRADAFSDGAVAKIQAAGGTVEVIPPRRPPVRNKMRSKAQKAEG